MVRALRILVAALLMATVGFAQAEELPVLAEKTRPSVVHLEVLDEGGEPVGSGTGFFIEDGRVVTNHHVVAGASGVRAVLADGRKVDVTGVLAADEDKDVAILVLPEQGPPLVLGSSEGLRQGDEVVVIGSPRGLAGTLSVGIVSALRGEGPLAETDEADDTRSWAIQITAAISPGSSGSPIMTREGEVVAVAVGVIIGGANIGFGVPIEEVKELLDGLPANAEPRPFETAGGSDVLRNLLYSGLFFGALGLAYVLARRREG